MTQIDSENANFLALSYVESYPKTCFYLHVSSGYGQKITKIFFLTQKHYLVTCRMQYISQFFKSYNYSYFSNKSVCPEGNFGPGFLEECGRCVNET